MKKYFFVVIILMCSGFVFLNQRKSDAQGNSMQLISSAFKSGEKLPQKFTCDGQDVNPPLQWQNAPEGTKSFALIVDDPDAPHGTWVHWIVFNIPSDHFKLDENVSTDKLNGARQGNNSNNALGFQGACPPHGHGVHRYYFTLFALDTMLNLPEGSSKSEIMKAVEGHVLQKAQIMATYERK